MPERWERELRKLGGLDVDEAPIRDRVRVGPFGPARPPDRSRLGAGLVAAVFGLASIALLWRALPEGEREIGSPAALPTLEVTFESNGTIGEDPPDADPIRRVDTSITYGDAHEESFTSTTPANAHVDWVAVEDVTTFEPGPTVGSAIAFDADGTDPRVLVGKPADWPNFDRFTRMDELPAEPGEYVLVFVADYPDGTARTARVIRLVEAGVLQVVARHGDDPRAGTAAAYVDGRGTDGVLRLGSFEDPDAEFGLAIEDVEFDADAWLAVEAGSRVMLAGTADHARARLYESLQSFRTDAPMPIDLLGGGTLDAAPGRVVMAVDVAWGELDGSGELASTERGIFLFPIEVVEPSVGEAPTPASSPSPAPSSEGSVVIDIRRLSAETGDPEAIARFGGREQWMCPDGWSLVNEAGETESVEFDCGQEDVFEAPPSTPIVVSGDFATANVSTELSGEGSAGAPTDEVADLPAGTVVTYAYEVTWDDGSEASFWLQVTVGGEIPEPGAPEGIVVHVYGVGERSNEEPTATFSFGGLTRTACTQDYEWAQVDGTVIGDEMPDTSACADRAIPVPPGTPIAIEADTTTRVSTTRTTTQFFEGDVGLVVSAEWPEGMATFIVPFEVVGEMDRPEIVLDCPPGDRIEFVRPDGPVILPGGSAFIRGNLAGFLQTDVIEQMTRHPGGDTEWHGTWQVVRDGSVVAAVDFSSLGGIACRGSGIGGV